MNHCDICDKDFYSDIEFAEHQKEHTLEQFMEETTLLGKANKFHLQTIYSQLFMMNIYMLQRYLKCTFEEATNLHMDNGNKLAEKTLELFGDTSWGK